LATYYFEQGQYVQSHQWFDKVEESTLTSDEKERFNFYKAYTFFNSGKKKEAKQYFNKVHMRSGLPEFIDPITLDVILKERFIEFSMEAMGWYDLVSLHYYNKAKAYSILNNQDRGLFFTKPNVMPDPTEWTFIKTSWFSERKIIANDGNFLLPIPDAELSQAPNLRKPPVDY